MLDELDIWGSYYDYDLISCYIVQKDPGLKFPDHIQTYYVLKTNKQKLPRNQAIKDIRAANVRVEWSPLIKPILIQFGFFQAEAILSRKSQGRNILLCIGQ